MQAVHGDTESYINMRSRVHIAYRAVRMGYIQLYDEQHDVSKQIKYSPFLLIVY